MRYPPGSGQDPAGRLNPPILPVTWPWVSTNRTTPCGLSGTTRPVPFSSAEMPSRFSPLGTGWSWMRGLVPPVAVSARTRLFS
jgi:hypothetical protein